MEISVTWYKPLNLEEEETNDNSIYSIAIDQLPDEAGCYIFYREFGKSKTIIYIGRAQNIKARIKSQLNHLRLMKGIQNSGKGSKLLMFCTLNIKRGQNLVRVLGLLEKNLIKEAFAQGYELLNIQGSKIHFHRIVFSGNRTSEYFFNRSILSPDK